MSKSINLIKSLNNNLDFNIVLTGFMGCGKTTVGKFLASKIGYKVFDTDIFIENKTGLTVSNIFKIYGENHFRTLEKICIKNLSFFSQIIISTGGGSILDNDNEKNLKRNGKIFFLDASLPTIISRLKSDFSRPLLKNKDFEKKLFYKRKNIYLSTADFIVDANRSIEQICKDIISKIKIIEK